MQIIGLEDKVIPDTGKAEHYWFENKAIGLEIARYHRIVIPLGTFHTGPDWVAQPESPEVTIEWLKVPAQDPSNLVGEYVHGKNMCGVEASVYLGDSHNWIELESLRVIEANSGFRLLLSGIIDFEAEGVGRNERIRLEVPVVYSGEA